MNEDDNQLRVAHLILGYMPISHAFQAPKCVIKVHDPRLHRINVAIEGFLLPEGALSPKGVPLVGGSSSCLVVEEEDEPTKGMPSGTEAPSRSRNPSTATLILWRRGSRALITHFGAWKA